MPTQTFTSTADTFVASYTPTTNYGTGTRMSAGYYLDNSLETMYCFVNFSTMPKMSAVSSATLTMYLREPGGAGNLTYYIRRCTSTWTETGVTWNNQPSVGGSDMASLVCNAAGWYTWTLSAAEMVAMSQSGFGLRMTGSGTSNYGYDGFDTREYGANQVYITATYTPSLSGSPMWWS